MAEQATMSNYISTISSRPLTGASISEWYAQPTSKNCYFWGTPFFHIDKVWSNSARSVTHSSWSSWPALRHHARKCKTILFCNSHAQSACKARSSFWGRPCLSYALAVRSKENHTTIKIKHDQDSPETGQQEGCSLLSLCPEDLTYLTHDAQASKSWVLQSFTECTPVMTQRYMFAL